MNVQCANQANSPLLTKRGISPIPIRSHDRRPTAEFLRESLLQCALFTDLPCVFGVVLQVALALVAGEFEDVITLLGIILVTFPFSVIGLLTFEFSCKRVMCKD